MRDRAPSVVLAVALVVGFAATACTAGPAGPFSGSSSIVSLPATSAAASVRPNPTPAGSYPPGDMFTFIGPEPAVTTALTGFPDEAFVNPGAVVADGSGLLHMFANVFTAWPGTVHVVHLTSKDGRTWRRVGAVPELSTPALRFSTPGSDVSTGFVAADGTWTLILESVSTSAPWQLYAATAPGPDGPWSVGSMPILSPGPAGSIDAGGLHWPSVVHARGGYLLAYTALGSTSTPGVIAVAQSADGRSWAKEDRPVLVPDRPWERALDRPRLAAVDGGFVMLYSGVPITNRGEARSNDGLTWTKVGDGPAIDRSRFPVAGQSWDAALTVVDGKLAYLLEIGSASGTTSDYVAFAGG